MTTPGTSKKPGLRERKKAQLRRALQREALRLFLAKGYDATTVEEIATAAGVSHMTFFRYFPAKEDVVMSDEYDPLIFELIAGRPAGEPPFDSILHALREGLSRIYAADRDAILVRTRLILSTPALRARLWEQQLTTERLFAHALAENSNGEVDQMRLRVVASSCLAAVTTAAAIWVENSESSELPDLVDQAFATLCLELGQTRG